MSYAIVVLLVAILAAILRTKRTIYHFRRKLMTVLEDLKAAEARREASDAKLEAKLKTVSDQLAALLAANGDSIPAADVAAVVTAMNAETDATDAAGA